MGLRKHGLELRLVKYLPKTVMIYDESKARQNGIYVLKKRHWIADIFNTPESVI